ncbi:class I SAM-dependent methyltransferase [bacterium]|nr:class I SAM-dependent methyltransferase [bacterium]
MNCDILNALSDNILAGIIEACENYTVDDPAGTQNQHYIKLPFTTMEQKDWAIAVSLWLEHGAPLIKSLADRPCPSCGSSINRFLFFSYDGYPFSECGKCGCWFVPKTITASLFEQFFVSCPKARVLAGLMVEKRTFQTNIHDDVNRIGEYLGELRPFIETVSQNFSYLDVGCGLGHSLIAAQEHGFLPEGVEIDQTAVNLAQKKGLLICHPEAFNQSKPYGLISFWETMEHMNAPAEELKRYVQYLDDHGIIALTVPNLDSPIVRLLRGDCSYVFGGYNTSGHINLFNVNNMTELLGRTGLSLLCADVQFTDNPFELFSYLSGLHHGARDYLLNQGDNTTFTKTTEDILNLLWPSISLVYRLSLKLPILKIVACKKGKEHVFKEISNHYRGKILEDIIIKAQAIKGKNDILTMNDTLQSYYSDINMLNNELTNANNELTNAKRKLSYPLVKLACYVSKKLVSLKNGITRRT